VTRLAAALAPICATVVCAAAPAVAAAGEVSDEILNYKLTVPDGWTRTELAEGSGGEDLVAMWTRDESDQIAVITKFVGPTDDAVNKEKTFFDDVEKGLKRNYAVYKRLSAKKTQIGKGKKKVPAYEVWFRTERDGKPVVIGARFLFFKGYALSLIIDQPGARRAGPMTKKLLGSFAPAKPTP
jgi:hypothetical protein